MIFDSSSDSFASDGVASTSDDLQQVQLPALVGRQVDLVVLRRLLGEAGAGVVRAPGWPRGDRFGVVGDEGLLHPAGLALLDAELQRRRVDVVEERLRVGGGRRRRGRGLRAGEHQRAEDDGRNVRELHALDYRSHAHRHRSRRHEDRRDRARRRWQRAGPPPHRLAARRLWRHARGGCRPRPRHRARCRRTGHRRRRHSGHRSRRPPAWSRTPIRPG